MAKIHADGTEEMRPRTPEEIAAIEEEVRKAKQTNFRREDRRKDKDSAKIVGALARERRMGERRTVLSTFERDALLKGGRK